MSESEGYELMRIILSCYFKNINTNDLRIVVLQRQTCQRLNSILYDSKK
jgi:hypothetical protein